MHHHTSTSGLTRRAALQIGAGMFGLSLPGYLRAAEAGKVDPSRRPVSCIFLFLAGGISHFESWDPKPDAPDNIRGPWRPTATNVPGAFITEKMPLLAQRMNKVAIVRSWQGVSGGHDIGSQHVMSGVLSRGQQYFPNFGCMVGALRGSPREGIPPYVGIPVDARYTNPTGYLGPAYGALNIADDPSLPGFQVRGLNIPTERFEGRQGLLRQINNLSQMAQTESQSLASHDKVLDAAVTTLTSGAIQRAARVGHEPLALRERYGMNIYGQRVLLARRLVEAGARFITINQAVQGGLFGAGQARGSRGWRFLKRRLAGHCLAPIFNNQTGLQDDFATTNPGVWVGRTDILSSTAMQGFDLNLNVNLLYYERSRFDFLVGFRSVYLNESLTIRDNVTPLVPGALTFQGGPVDPPSTIVDLDRFRTGNNFYGGQVGMHWQAMQGPFALDVTGKIALGANQQVVTIDGATTLNTPGAATMTAPGGLLAQTTNMGRHYRSAFSAVPEIGVNLSYQVTPRLKATVGYTFLYWSNVVRPGNQIDHNINPALPPGDQGFGNGLGQNRPAFNAQSTGFWAQGINIGFEFRF